MKQRYQFTISALFTLLLSLSFSAQATFNERVSFYLDSFKEERNIDIVRTAYTTAIIEGNPDGLRFFSEDYIQHNPTAPNGLGFVRSLFIDNRPETMEVEIGEIIAEGDFVAVHARFSGLGTTAIIAVDLFRVVNGVIVEHWDVVQNEVPVEDSASGNAMFPVTGSGGPSSDEAKNRAMVINATNRLFGTSDPSAVDEFWDENYIQHSPTAPNGSEFLKQLVSSEPTGDASYEAGFAIAYGDLVLLQTRFTFQGVTNITFDYYRVEDGLIKEHWDVFQQEVPIAETVSGNPMFPAF